MQYRQLGRSGVRVSTIGIGTNRFGSEAVPQEVVSSIVDAAFDLGINHLDTANVYGLGLSEEIIGRFLKGDPGAFAIATKAGIWRDREHGNRGFRNDAAYLRSELDGSLRRLGLDRVDLFYVHRRDHTIEIEEVMDTLLALKGEGKIGGIGFSEIAPASLRRAAAVGPVDAVQSE